MILVVVEVKVEPGAAVQAREAIQNMETATRAEPGCLTYAFSVDLNDDTTMRVIERWRSPEDLKLHLASPHMAEFNRAIMEIRPQGLEVKAYEATEVPLG